jgi:hypothetical protein
MGCPNSKNRPKKGLHPLGVKTKKFLVARVERKNTFLSISPQPQIKNL